MIKTQIAYLSTLMVFIVGCSSFASNAQDQSNHNVLEPLYGISMIKNAVKIKVRSTGCTNEEDFVIDLNISESAPHLAVKRTKPDMCRRMPQIITIEKSLDYSALEPNLSIMLLNPLKVSDK